MVPKSFDAGTTVIAAGWTCASCSAWVPIGTYHACGGSFPAPIAPVAPIAPDRSAEIIGKLDEIIGLLKQMLMEN